jgi:hypothetical protein
MDDSRARAARASQLARHLERRVSERRRDGGGRLQAIWELSVADDLILSKHAAARPQDLVDAKHLERERALKKG